MDLTAIINGIRQRTAFGVWRLSRIVVHVALHVSARFLPMAEWRSTARAHRSSPFRSSASGHSGYHLFAIKNNPDTNFLITCQTLCTPAAPLYFPTTAPEGSDFPTSSALASPSPQALFVSSHPRGWEGRAHCGFDWHFPIDSWEASFHVLVGPLYFLGGAVCSNPMPI